jgi:hypothetical protein
MGNPVVGGDPVVIGAGGRQLAAAATQISSRAAGLEQVGTRGVSAAGGSAVGTALTRFIAAYSQFTADVGTEVNALATLAGNTAVDLHHAGGGAGGRRAAAR